MRILVVFILFLLFGVTEGKTQRLNDAKTQSEDSATLRLCDSASFHESQIRLADSLYKNYLPQSNFEEVKAAMEFFDSIRNEELAIRNYGRRKAIPNSTFLIPNYQCAKAHYYHAVGLTERDDIVGACEHYLTALEIMEPLVETSPLWRLNIEDKREKSVDRSLLTVDNPEDYEKIRFLALTYTRLGRLFLNENYCDLAIAKYRKALKYVKMIDDIPFKSNILKELGNSYQLANKPDSALYYYGESLRYNSSLPNRLDVEKSIAKILFHKGEKDSAYVLLKNNLREIDNENLKYSYHCTLGDVYYSDKKYDSALYYLETSLDNDIVTKKVAFTSKLSAIYDSLGDYDKRDYYDNFSVKMFLNHANKEVDNKQLQVLYDNYKERKNEREKSIAKVRTRKLIIAISLGVFVILVSFTIFLKYRNKRHIDKLTEKIDDYANENKRLIDDFKKSNNKKDKIIDKQKKEIDRIKTRISKKNVNIEAYYASDICKKILSRKDNDFSSLKEDELALLLKSADEHLDNISERLHNSFSGLNKNDIYTICLLILNIEKGKLQYLLGKDRKTIWNRLNKIKSLMNVDKNQDLFLYIKENFLN